MIQGTISSESDIDYYYISFPSSYTTYFDLTLSVPSGCDYDMYVYNSYNQAFVGSSTSAVSGGDEYLRCQQNTPYGVFVKVVGKNGSYHTSLKYVLTGSFSIKNLAWFSQRSTTINQIDYWNGQYMNILYFNSGIKPFITNDNVNNDVMSSGCPVAAYSMILRNKNRKKYKTVYNSRGGFTRSESDYDFRSGYTGLLPADPFTVMLANNKKMVQM